MKLFDISILFDIFILFHSFHLLYLSGENVIDKKKNNKYQLLIINMFLYIYNKKK